jgi:hypothetical protein
MQLSIFSSADLPVSPSPSPDSVRDWLIRVGTSLLRSLPLLTAIAPSGWSGRTCPAYYPQLPTTLRIHVHRRHRWIWDATEQRWKLTTSTSQKRYTHSTACWPDFQSSGITEPTGVLTLNTSTWRNGGSACLLSSILETGDVPPRFYLSAKACRGILRRAEKRGKTLPTPLRAALMAAALKVGGGKPGQGYPAVAFADLADPVAANQGRTYTREGTNNFRLSNVAIQTMQVRRLTPRECERLQGFPEVLKSYRIEVCGDQRKNPAHVEVPSPKSQSVAGSADVSQLESLASSAELTSPASHHKTSRPVVVSVEIDSEVGTMRLAIPASGWSEHVRIADESARTFLATPSGDFARLIVATLSSQVRIVHRGRVEAPQSSKRFSHHGSGSQFVSLSGQEIEAAAESVERVMSEVTRCFTFTTSEVGSSFQSCGWSLQTLCSCVALAIGSFIPAEILAGNSFSIELTHRTPYTLIPYRGKPAADGPRYKALGNSMAVPVMRWIGQRIALVEEVLT